MIVSAWKAFWRQFGFYKEPVSDTYAWQEHPFFSEAAHKSRRLAQIARQRDALKERLAKAIRDKKARAPIYAKLRALSVEELRVEAGK